MAWTKGQWPRAITTGDICYRHVPKNCGMGEWYALSDASHGIPIFGSVKASDDANTISGAAVNVFNYPGQTEQIAAELVKRWNCHKQLLEALKAVVSVADRKTVEFDQARAAIAAAEGAQS